MQQEHRKEGVAAPVVVNELPPCCGTGCAVCVLDYPELFSTCDAGNQPNHEIDADTLAMLEAIEQAQAQAERFNADFGNEF